MSEIGQAIIAFPKYFAMFLLGFVVVILTELDMTALLLAAVALGLAVQSVLWAIFFFLVAWIVLRSLGALVLIGHAIQYHANRIPSV